MISSWALPVRTAYMHVSTVYTRTHAAAEQVCHMSRISLVFSLSHGLASIMVKLVKVCAAFGVANISKLSEMWVWTVVQKHPVVHCPDCVSCMCHSYICLSHLLLDSWRNIGAALDSSCHLIENGKHLLLRSFFEPLCTITFNRWHRVLHDIQVRICDAQGAHSLRYFK